MVMKKKGLQLYHVLEKDLQVPTQRENMYPQLNERTLKVGNCHVLPSPLRTEKETENAIETGMSVGTATTEGTGKTDGTETAGTERSVGWDPTRARPGPAIPRAHLVGRCFRELLLRLLLGRRAYLFLKFRPYHKCSKSHRCSRSKCLKFLKDLLGRCRLCPKDLNSTPIIIRLITLRLVQWCSTHRVALLW